MQSKLILRASTRKPFGVGLPLGPSALRFEGAPGQAKGGEVLGPGAPGAFDAAWVLCPAIVVEAEGRHRMLFMALEPRRAIFVAESTDGLQGRMLNGGEPIISPRGAGYARDLVVHAFVRRDGTRLRAWVTGYDRRAGPLADWKLAVGMYETTLP